MPGQGTGQSFGNTDTNANKGFNQPYQIAVLNLLKDIRKGTSGGITSTSNASTIERVSTTKTYPANTLVAISVYNAGSVTGTFNGVNLLAGERVSFSANQGATIRTEYNLVATGTDFLITTIVP